MERLIPLLYLESSHVDFLWMVQGYFLHHQREEARAWQESVREYVQDDQHEMMGEQLLSTEPPLLKNTKVFAVGKQQARRTGQITIGTSFQLSGSVDPGSFHSHTSWSKT